MSFDLTNKNIQDTFQNLLQKTGSDGRLHDLVGNQVDDLTLTNISASGHISASKFVGDGSELEFMKAGGSYAIVFGKFREIIINKNINILNKLGGTLLFFVGLWLLFY